MKILQLLEQLILFPFRFIRGRTQETQEIENIKPGSGDIIEEDGKKIAVYKDKHENITKLSPTCTHLGCLVHWDSQENVWTCKCHKSHFKPEGQLIDGPAVKNLKKLNSEKDNHHKSKILMTEFVTHDTIRFILEKPTNYQFTPGQATLVSINKPKLKDEKRPFTFTSLNQDKVLEFTIKKYPEHNGVTQKLHNLEPGDELFLEDPWGTINYAGKGIFIAGGAGITPFIAIFRQLKKESKLKGNKLFFSNKTQKDVILEKELRSLFNKKDLILTLTRQEKTPGFQGGRINKKFLKENIKDFSQNFYVCGPPKFTESITDALEKLGAQTDEIVIEE